MISDPKLRLGVMMHKLKCDYGKHTFQGIKKSFDYTVYINYRLNELKNFTSNVIPTHIPKYLGVI